jgi:hypothetical protein
VDAGDEQVVVSARLLERWSANTLELGDLILKTGFQARVHEVVRLSTNTTYAFVARVRRAA